MKFYYLLFLFAVQSEKIIKNIKINTIKDIELPSCRNCIYYKPSVYSNDFTSPTSKCEKIGKKNILTGKISYDFADSCRNDELKCGKEGKYFEEEKELGMKMFIYKLTSILPETLLVSLFVFSLLLQFSIYTKN